MARCRRYERRLRQTMLPGSTSLRAGDFNARAILCGRSFRNLHKRLMLRDVYEKCQNS